MFVRISQSPRTAIQDASFTVTGIIHLVIHQAKDLDTALRRQPALIAQVYLEKPGLVHTTGTARVAQDPSWESHKELICFDRGRCILTVKIIDESPESLSKDSSLGQVTVKLDDLLQATMPGRRNPMDWWPLTGCRSGRIRMSADWVGLDVTEPKGPGPAPMQPFAGAPRMQQSGVGRMAPQTVHTDWNAPIGQQLTYGQGLR